MQGSPWGSRCVLPAEESSPGVTQATLTCHFLCFRTGGHLGFSLLRVGHSACRGECPRSEGRKSVSSRDDVVEDEGPPESELTQVRVRTSVGETRGVRGGGGSRGGERGDPGVGRRRGAPVTGAPHEMLEKGGAFSTSPRSSRAFGTHTPPPGARGDLGIANRQNPRPVPGDIVERVWVAGHSSDHCGSPFPGVHKSPAAHWLSPWPAGWDS